MRKSDYFLPIKEYGGSHFKEKVIIPPKKPNIFVRGIRKMKRIIKGDK